MKKMSSGSSFHFLQNARFPKGRKGIAGLELLLVLIVVIAAIYFASKSGFLGSIAGLSKVQIKTVESSGGTYYWVADIIVNRPGETSSWIYQGTNYDTSNGVLQPQSTFDISYAPKSADCKYAMTQGVDGHSDFASARLQYPTAGLYYTVSIDKNGKSVVSKTFNAYSHDVDVLKDPDGNGTVYLENAIVGRGPLDCPQAPTIYVYRMPDGKNIVTTKTIHDIIWNCLAYDQFGDLGWKQCQYDILYQSGLCRDEVARCMETTNVASDPTGFLNQFNNVDYYWSNGTLIGHGSYDNYGTVMITAKADAAMFETMLWKPATVSEPSILSATIPGICGGKQGTASVTIQNVGDVAGKFYVTMDSPNLVYTPNTQTVQALDAGKSYILSFSVTAGSTAATTSTTVKACGSGEFGDKCVTKIITSNIISCGGGVNPNPSYCGNGVCDSEIGETSTTCASDCRNVPDCQTQYGAGWYWDKTKETCVQPEQQPNWALIAIGVAVILGIFMVLATVLGKKK
jgi:hypothetical protein